MRHERRVPASDRWLLVLPLLACVVLAGFWAVRRILSAPQPARPWERQGQLNQARKEYLSKEVPGKRGQAFQALAMEINFKFNGYGGVTLEDVLRNLGPPDYVGGDRAAPDCFLYLYDRSGTNDARVRFQFNLAGDVTGMFWNMTSAEELTALSPWSQMPPTQATATARSHAVRGSE